MLTMSVTVQADVASVAPTHPLFSSLSFESDLRFVREKESPWFR